MRYLYKLPLLACIALLFSCSENKTSENTQPQNGTPNTQKSKAPDAVTIQQFELKPGVAGFIPVGISSDSLKKMVPAENLKATKRELEGQQYTAYEVRNAKAANQLLMLAEESCQQDSCAIFRLRILSPKFKTEQGIRIGSTFADLKKAYTFNYVGIGEADFVAMSEKQRMAFALDISGFPPKPLYKIKTQDIPDSTKVTSILMF